MSTLARPRTVFALPLLALLVGILPLPGRADPPPQTGFETRAGADWTTHEEELAFLAAVDGASPRVQVNVVGRTAQDRPLHLVRLGDPAPADAEGARDRPTVLFTCSQHGNEPAGREACLQWLRDLAFTTDAGQLAWLRSITVLFVPAANPDGRAANARENSDGTDINRDHLNLTSAEAQAIAEVVRDWEPDLVMDLHEYGPSQPVLYDDDVLYLWPRNLNVDQQVHDAGLGFALETVKPCAEEGGYTADEYGQQAVGDTDIAQTAGDQDEGILRNTMGLRHAVGILVETRVDMDVTQSPTELIFPAEVNLRRVASHHLVVGCTLGFVASNGDRLHSLSDAAAARKTAEGSNRSAPVYFGGADNTEPTAEQVVDPPPCAYDLTAAQAQAEAETLALLGAESEPRGAGVRVPLGQRAEPLLPLLLDERGLRHAVEGTPVMVCAAAAAPATPVAPPAAPLPRPPLAATGAGDLAPVTALLLLAAAALLRGRLGLRPS